MRREPRSICFWRSSNRHEPLPCKITPFCCLQNGVAFLWYDVYRTVKETGWGWRQKTLIPFRFRPKPKTSHGPDHLLLAFGQFTLSIPVFLPYSAASRRFGRVRWRDLLVEDGSEKHWQRLCGQTDQIWEARHDLARLQLVKENGGRDVTDTFTPDSVRGRARRTGRPFPAARHACPARRCACPQRRRCDQRRGWWRAGAQ